MAHRTLQPTTGPSRHVPYMQATDWLQHHVTHVCDIIGEGPAGNPRAPVVVGEVKNSYVFYFSTGGRQGSF